MSAGPEALDVTPPPSERQGESFLNGVFEGGNWIRRVDSFEGLARAMQNPETKAAFYIPPRLPKNILDALLTIPTWGENEIGAEYLQLWSGKINLNTSDAGFTVLLDAAFDSFRTSAQESPRAADLLPFNDFLKGVIRKTHAEFPDYSLISFHIRRGISRGAKRWHQDETDEKQWIRILQVLNGKSPEFAKDEAGNAALSVPRNAMTVHRPKTSSQEGAWHRAPQDEDDARLTLAIDLLKS